MRIVRAHRVSILPAIAVILSGASLSAPLSADWKPAPGPLMTRWAKDVSPDHVLPEYPRPQFAREQWMNLNGLWQFAPAQPGEEPPVGKDLDKKILVPFAVESALSGIGEKHEEIWYRRTFNVDDWIASSKRVLLHFGAVDWRARVWVNGIWVGQHDGGYDRFTLDITDALRASGDQEVIVGVWDPSDLGSQPCGKQAVEPHSIWYTSITGIWQTVWLEPVSPAHVDSIVLTPDIDANRLLAKVDVRGLSTPGTVRLVARDPSTGAVVGGLRLAVDPQTPSAEGHLLLENVKLWSPDVPFLYDLEIVLDTDDAEVDRATSYFGMRKISLDKDADGRTRLFLNNEEVFHFGPLDQGFWPDGLYTAPADEALRYDVEITKQLGFNMTRKHVKIEPDRWYYWTDKLGLLVWQDMPSGDDRIAPIQPDIRRRAQSARQFETELKAMIDGLRNHPSIVHWVVFNEGWGQYDTKRLAEWTKGYDPSRLVIATSGWADRKVGDIYDLHNYPPPRSPKPEENRAAVNGEYGGLGLPIEGHTWQAKNNWGYQQLGSIDDLMNRYANFIDRVRVLRGDPGMSAAVYTQITDVEIEVNGLLTYDREVLKGDLYKYRELNTSVHRPPPILRPVLETSAKRGQSWKYTTESPAEGWQNPEFDDKDWKSGNAGFGKAGTPNAVIRTSWLTPDLWLRRTVTWPETIEGTVKLWIHHDDECEIFVNGKLLKSLTGWTTDYDIVELSAEEVGLFTAGENTIAVHVHQDSGGQFFDMGMIERMGD